MTHGVSDHLHDPRPLPPLLRLHPALPRQGHPGARRSGRGDGGAVHRLRAVCRRVFAGSEGDPEPPRGREPVAGRGRRCRGPARPFVPGRLPRLAAQPGRRGAQTSWLRGRLRGGLRCRPGEPRVLRHVPAGSEPSAAHHTLSRHLHVHRQACRRTGAVPRADPLPDGRDGEGTQGAPAAGLRDRLLRTLHGENPRTRRFQRGAVDRRRDDLPRIGTAVGRPRHRPRGPERRTARSSLFQLGQRLSAPRRTPSARRTCPAIF